MPNTPTARLADDAAYIAALVDLRDASATPAPDAQPERTCANCDFWYRQYGSQGMCDLHSLENGPVALVASCYATYKTQETFCCAGWQPRPIEEVNND